ncbi:hypothetical protein FJZ36_16150 [Candidatus Poribacteria bacterium]|nr:hypothetical protein [Candidatus Poribacteria bacterium]
MALPTVKDVHQDSVLSNLSVQYRNGDLIGSRAIPKVLVRKASDKFYEFTQGDWFRNDAGARASTTTGPVGGYRLSTQNYNTTQYSMATYVADEERDNADEGLDLDRQAVEYCTDKVLMKFEKEAATLLFSAGSYASGHTVTLTGTDQWSDGGSSPIEDIRAGANVIAGKIGRHPNTLVLGDEVYSKLQDHASVLDRIKYTQKGIVTPDLLAGLFDVERVLVGRGIENTAAEGVTPSYARLWGKHAALLYVPEQAGLRTLSFAYWFVWRGYDFATERWRKSDGGNADGFRVRAQWDAKVVSDTAGYLIVNAVA